MHIVVDAYSNRCCVIFASNFLSLPNPCVEWKNLIIRFYSIHTTYSYSNHQFVIRYSGLNVFPVTRNTEKCTLFQVLYLKGRLYISQ